MACGTDVRSSERRTKIFWLEEKRRRFTEYHDIARSRIFRATRYVLETKLREMDMKKHNMGIWPVRRGKEKGKQWIMVT